MKFFFITSFVFGLIIWNTQTFITPKDDKAQYESISLADTLILLKQPNNMIIDAREYAFFRAGHIPNALNLPVSSIKNDKDLSALLEKIRVVPNIIIYCDTLHCSADLRIASFLGEKGIDNIKIYLGGYQEWKACGLPIEKDKKNE